MPVELKLYGQPVDTVFDLLGDKENDITYSVGWALAESEQFSRAALRGHFACGGRTRVGGGGLQEGIPGGGITHNEVRGGGGKFRLVIEAKRGYSLPGEAQLAK